MGGLGLFDLQSFLDAQKIAWVKCAKTIDDWWKISMYSRCYGTFFNVRSKDFDARSEPCLTSIVSGYEKLMVSLTKVNENFLGAYLFDNKALTLGLRDNRVFDDSIFNVVFFNEYGKRIKKLCTSDLFNGNNYVGHNDFRINTGIPCSLFHYQMLKGIIKPAKIRYRKDMQEEKTTVEVATFVNRSKEGK
jgi:hypothetical protein